MSDLQNVFSWPTRISFEYFNKKKKKTWDHRHLLKKRHVEAYQSPFINENVNTEIMKKSQLRNTFLSPKNDAVRKPKT